MKSKQSVISHVEHETYTTKSEAYAQASLQFARWKIANPQAITVAFTPSGVTKAMDALFGVYVLVPYSGNSQGYMVTIFYHVTKEKKSKSEDSATHLTCTVEKEVG